MSLDSGLSAALVAKKHDIARTVLARKRKLCDLYAVATSTLPLPAPYRDFQLDSSTPQNHPLAIFLSQNDLEKGRYFRASTLPSRPQQATFITKSQRNPKGATQSHQPLRSVLTEKFVGNEALPSRVGQAESEPDHELSVQPIAHPDGLENAPEDSIDRTKTHPNNSTKESGRSRLASGAASDVRSLRSSKHPTPVPIIESHVGPENHSRPQSPPYSPGSEAIAAGNALVRDASLDKARHQSANVLTPTKDEHDDSSSSQEHGESRVNSSDRLTAESKQEGQARPRPTTIVDAGDTLSSHSSVTGQHSANTPRSEPRSPFTSPDEDVNQEAQTSTPAQLPSAEDENGNAIQSRSKSSLEAVDTTSKQDIDEDEVYVDAATGFENSYKPNPTEVEHDSLNVEPKHKSDVRVSTPDTRKSADLELPGVTATAKSSSDPERLDKVELDDPSPMDIDEPTKQPNRQPARSPLGDETRITKPDLSRWRRKIIKVGYSKTSLPRNNAQDRERLQHPKSKIIRPDYLKPQVVREILNAAYKQDLNALLTNCNVTITTLDWMLHNEEELFRILLQRTQHLQNTNRWSLKQIAAYEEPAPKLCHWDHLLQEAKWLRTDFREERKLKTSVACQLAYWCAEWVNASADQRLKLRTKNDVSLNRGETRPTKSGAESKRLSLGGHAGDIKVERSFAGDEEMIFGSSDIALWAGKNARISKNVLSKIPEYSTVIPVDSQGASKRMLVSTAQASREQTSGSDGSLVRSNTGKDTSRVPNLPPVDTSCALFAPEYKAMRARLNAVWIYKPPQVPMPSQSFYEFRTPSQWSWEDDQQLRQSLKDYGVNWHMISQNMTPRQEFYTTSDRRTPWECYERLLILDPPQHDIQARQYLKHFHFRIEKARAAFEEQQSFIRAQAQQHARDVGQPPPNVPHKRFPTPTRVERKPSKRLLAMIDASRKLARKRETMQTKQEKLQQVDAQAQRPPPAQLLPNGQPHTPQYFSRMKYERELKDNERLREQQRVTVMEQQRRQAGYQASLTNGIGQQMRNGMANGQVAANGHLAVPSNNQFRPPSQQLGIHGGMPNGIPSNAQMVANARLQANMQNQQRLAPHLNGQVAPNQETMARLMQHAQAQQQQQQQQQHRFQQFSRGSPNMVNTASNPGMLSSYNTNTQFIPTSDGVQSPTNNTQQSQTNPTSHQSPHMAHALAAAVGSSQQQQQQQATAAQNAPQALSSGHVPHFMTIQHQIQKSNPNLTVQEARNQATEQLKFYMRQNALNAASGMPNSNQLPTGNASGNADNNNSSGGGGGGGGSQSPYLNPTQRQSPFQQNGILASNHHQHQLQVGGGGRGQSPSNAPTQLQQNQYQAQLRQQMYNQQRHNQQQQQQQQLAMASSSSGSGADGSPGLAHALPSNLGLGNMGLGVPSTGAFAATSTAAAAAAAAAAGGAAGSTSNRTPTPVGSVAKRPLSRAAGSGGAMDVPGFGTSPQTTAEPQLPQRPGSAAGMASQSPRAMSAQSFNG